MSHTAIVPEPTAIRNYLLKHRLPLHFSKPVLAHLETYMTAATAKGFRGKVTDLEEYSDCHRTTLGHFLGEGVWDETVLQNKVKTESLRQILETSRRTAEPLFVIQDDTILLRKQSLRHRPVFRSSKPAFITLICWARWSGDIRCKPRFSAVPTSP